jgi:predicted metal-dependent phosphoesterase TrpH
MRCDLHVHTIHSGMCTVPVFDRFCRESYNDPLEVYEVLKRRGMDLVTITDHDSIGAAEPLRKYPDFFLSEEVTCRTPDGTELHVGVYDINERHHIDLQRRRDDLLSLISYLREQRLLFSVNHVFSSLTGRRTDSDFAMFEQHFPAVETRNGQMPIRGNGAAARLAKHWGKAPVAGSDAHTLRPLGLTYTDVPGASGKAEFLEQLRNAGGIAHGETGSYSKLTRSVLDIGLAFIKERPWALAVAPLLLAVPAITLVNCLMEDVFARKWARRILPVSTLDKRRPVAAAFSPGLD